MTELPEISKRVGRHPDRLRLQQFGRGSLALAPSRLVVRHLLAGCPRCRLVTARFLPSPAAGGRLQVGRTTTTSSADRVDYRPAFAAADRELRRRQIALAAELADALDLRREIAGRSFEDQWQQVTRDARFHTWSFCDLLLDDSREWGFQDPGRARDCAELGAAVVTCLCAETYGETRIHDLAARAWATLANVERIRANFRAAELGFAKAEQLLRMGTGDPLERARFLLQRSSLLSNQGRPREALSLLDRVAQIARRGGERHLAGKALLARGAILGSFGDSEEAIRALSLGLSEIAASAPGDIEAEPRLLVAARHNLIHCLSESGRYREALQLLGPTRALYGTLADRLSEVRLQWVEGRIHLGMGDLDAAEVLLREVARQFVACQLPHDAALVFLDLARVYLRQGRSCEMRRLATEVVPIFRAALVEREMLAAFIVFQQAVEMERVTLDLVQEFTVYVQNCRTGTSSPPIDPI